MTAFVLLLAMVAEPIPQQKYVLTRFVDWDGRTKTKWVYHGWFYGCWGTEDVTWPLPWPDAA